ncbi:MAG: hypothetical protein JW807_17800 [Spirochaetes bacterium]|nr:hypothetical protein [Spirochaetota bacterium]
MPDVQKPMLLTLLAVLAIIVGVFSSIRGGLMIFGGISQIMAGVGGVFEIILGVLSLAVGLAALVCGIMVIWDKAGGTGLMLIYAIALIGYNAIWVVYSIATGGKISWLSVISELLIGAVTIFQLRINEDILSYREWIGKK